MQVDCVAMIWLPVARSTHHFAAIVQVVQTDDALRSRCTAHKSLCAAKAVSMIGADRGPNFIEGTEVQVCVGVSVRMMCKNVSNGLG